MRRGRRGSEGNGRRVERRESGKNDVDRQVGGRVKESVVLEKREEKRGEERESVAGPEWLYLYSIQITAPTSPSPFSIKCHHWPKHKQATPPPRPRLHVISGGRWGKLNPIILFLGWCWWAVFTKPGLTESVLCY